MFGAQGEQRFGEIDLGLAHEGVKGALAEGCESQRDAAAVADGDAAEDEALFDEAINEAGGGGEGEGELIGEHGEIGTGAFVEEAHSAHMDEGGAFVMAGTIFTDSDQDFEDGFQNRSGTLGHFTCILQLLHVSIMQVFDSRCKGALRGTSNFRVR